MAENTEPPAAKVNQEQSEFCSICLDSIDTEDCAAVQPCLHSFHHVCIKQWSKMKCACPLCKGRFTRLLYRGRSERVRVLRGRDNEVNDSHSDEEAIEGDDDNVASNDNDDLRCSICSEMYDLNLLDYVVPCNSRNCSRAAHHTCVAQSTDRVRGQWCCPDCADLHRQRRRERVARSYRNLQVLYGRCANRRDNFITYLQQAYQREERMQPSFASAAVQALYLRNKSASAYRFNTNAAASATSHERHNDAPRVLRLDPQRAFRGSDAESERDSDEASSCSDFNMDQHHNREWEVDDFNFSHAQMKRSSDAGNRSASVLRRRQEKKGKNSILGTHMPSLETIQEHNEAIANGNAIAGTSASSSSSSSSSADDGSAVSLILSSAAVNEDVWADYVVASNNLKYRSSQNTGTLNKITSPSYEGGTISKLRHRPESFENVSLIPQSSVNFPRAKRRFPGERMNAGSASATTVSSVVRMKSTPEKCSASSIPKGLSTSGEPYKKRKFSDLLASFAAVTPVMKNCTSHLRNPNQMKRESNSRLSNRNDTSGDATAPPGGQGGSVHTKEDSKTHKSVKRSALISEVLASLTHNS